MKWSDICNIKNWKLLCKLTLQLLRNLVVNEENSLKTLKLFETILKIFAKYFF